MVDKSLDADADENETRMDADQQRIKNGTDLHGSTRISISGRSAFIRVDPRPVKKNRSVSIRVDPRPVKQADP
jgi:hypothetical protein